MAGLLATDNSSTPPAIAPEMRHSDELARSSAPFGTQAGGKFVGRALVLGQASTGASRRNQRFAHTRCNLR